MKRQIDELAVIAQSVNEGNEALQCSKMSERKEDDGVSNLQKIVVYNI